MFMNYSVLVNFLTIARFFSTSIDAMPLMQICKIWNWISPRSIPFLIVFHRIMIQISIKFNTASVETHGVNCKI